MTKHLSCFNLLTAVCLVISFRAPAQINLSAKNIDKIIIIDGYANLNGRSHTDYEVKNKSGTWANTQTAFFNSVGTPIPKIDSSIDSHERKFIANLDKAYISNFLFALCHPLKTLQPQTLGISSLYLKENLDSLYKNSNRLNPAQLAIFKAQITPQNINKAIQANLTSEWTDVMAYCSIKIITKTGDTTTIESKMFSDFMFPWIINKQTTAYNVEISRFCAAVVNRKHSNKMLLNGESAYEAIFSYINAVYIEKRKVN